MRPRVKNILKKWIKGDLRDLYWTFYGKSVTNPQLPEKPRSVLFICKGNICRSPFAEKLAIHLAERESLEDFHFSSAGIEVFGPETSPDLALSAAKGFGVDLNGHMSKGITQEMIDSFDLIVAMQVWQVKSLIEKFPGDRDRFFLLPLFEENRGAKGAFLDYNIEDPYGRSLEEFESCFFRIGRCLEGLFTEMRFKKALK